MAENAISTACTEQERRAGLGFLLACCWRRVDNLCMWYKVYQLRTVSCNVQWLQQ
jgi:hypothetical protein